MSHRMQGKSCRSSYLFAPILVNTAALIMAHDGLSIQKDGYDGRVLGLNWPFSMFFFHHPRCFVSILNPVSRHIPVYQHVAIPTRELSSVSSSIALSSQHTASCSATREYAKVQEISRSACSPRAAPEDRHSIHMLEYIYIYEQVQPLMFVRFMWFMGNGWHGQELLCFVNFTICCTYSFIFAHLC